VANNICLVGPMGAGKSTIGKKLAARLGMEFVDCDDEIEARTGTTIPVIFDIEGEAGFRDREEKILSDLLDISNRVIATGGGCVIRENNRAQLLSAGTVIYLSTDVQEQLKRTGKSRHRPLLETPDRESRLTEMAKIREPLYEEVATLTVHSQGRKAVTVVQEIIEQLDHENY